MNHRTSITITYTLGGMPQVLDNSSPKKPKGHPRVRASHGRLQLVWTYKGERRNLSLGLDDTPSNRVKGEDIAGAIWGDIRLNRYDSSNLQQYLPNYLQRNTDIKKQITLHVSVSYGVITSNP